MSGKTIMATLIMMCLASASYISGNVTLNISHGSTVDYTVTFIDMLDAKGYGLTTFDFVPATGTTYNISFTINGEQYIFPDTGTAYHPFGAYASGGLNVTQVTVINDLTSLGTSSKATALYDGSTIEIDGYIDNPWMSVGVYQNYLLQTEVMGTTWARDGIATAVGANNAISPRETATAEWIPPGTSNTSNLYQNVSNSALGNWTFSVYLKSNSGTNVSLSLGQYAGENDAKELNITDRWKRYQVTHDFVGAHTIKTVRIIVGTNNVSAWGAQLEPNWAARPYSGARTTSALTTVTSTATLSSALTIAGALGGVSTGTASGGWDAGVGSLTNQSFTRGFYGYGSAASATVLSRNSPTMKLESEAWNGSASKGNSIEWYVHSLGENTTNTSPEACFKTYLENDVITNRTLACFNTTTATFLTNVSMPYYSFCNGSCTPYYVPRFINNSNNSLQNSRITDTSSTTKINGGTGACSWGTDAFMTMEGSATAFEILQTPLETVNSLEGYPGLVIEEIEGTVSAVFKDDLGEYMYFNFIVPHNAREKQEAWMFRIHWWQESEEEVDWRVNMLNSPRCKEAEITTDQKLTEYCRFQGKPIHQISYWSSKTEIMPDDLISIRLWREAGDESGRDAHVFVADLLYEVNTLGTDTEWS